MSKNAIFSLWSGLAMICCLVMPACSKTNTEDDASALLKTVPSDAALVVVTDIANMASKLGVAEQDGKIIFSKDIFSALFDADSGIRQSAAVVYLSNLTPIFTGFIDDIDTFKSIIEENEGKIWKNENNYQICGSVVLQDNQFWYFIKYADESTINKQINVKSKDSIIENSHISDIFPIDKELKFYLDYPRFISQMATIADPQKVFILNNMVSISAADLAYCIGSINFDTDRIIANVQAFGMNGKPAEPKFKLSQLDKELLNQIPSDANIVIGFGTTSQMWMSLLTDIQPALPMVLGNSKNNDAIFRNIASILSNIDGSLIAGINSQKKADPNATLLLQSQNSEGAIQIINGIKTLLPIAEHIKGLSMTSVGNIAKISYENIAQEFGKPDIAHLFNGTSVAFYLDGSVMNEGLKTDIFTRLEMFGGDNGNTMQMLLIINNGKYDNSLAAIVGEFIKK